MWFSSGSGARAGIAPTNNLQGHGIKESQEEIRNALNATHCYDLMRNSTKVGHLTVSYECGVCCVAVLWDLKNNAHKRNHDVH